MIAQAKSGLDAATKRPRLAGVPGGDRRHSCTISALANFRKELSREESGIRCGDASGRGYGTGAVSDSLQATAPVVSSSEYCCCAWALYISLCRGVHACGIRLSFPRS